MSVPPTFTSGLVKISSCASSGKSAAMYEQPAWISVLNAVEPHASAISATASTWGRSRFR